jgi:hypothetical protein
LRHKVGMSNCQDRCRREARGTLHSTSNSSTMKESHNVKDWVVERGEFEPSDDSANGQ